VYKCFLNSYFATLGDILSNKSLKDKENLIVDLLRKKPYGFNEMCRALAKHFSPPTIRKLLDDLVEAQLVLEEKGRRGQKATYTLTETMEKFEEKIRSLELSWGELFHKLKQLENHVNKGKLRYEDAGSLLVWLIFEAVPLMPLTLAPSFPLKLNERLLGFSASMFHTYWEEIIRYGRSHPEIRAGFHKGCKELSNYVKPVTEKIEEALGK
jgi:DNA-binding HxlR family transcriptional regulator